MLRAMASISVLYHIEQSELTTVAVPKYRVCIVTIPVLSGTGTVATWVAFTKSIELARSIALVKIYALLKMGCYRSA